jgi:hypothetical protein
MKRREFITLLGGTAAAWPMAARAQQSGRRVGVLVSSAESDARGQEVAKAFRTRLSQLGWVDGDNVRIDYRWAAGHTDRFVTAAQELVALKPDVVVADTTPAVQAFRRETQTIPIVFIAVTDPIGQGILQSLARPAGNITGFMSYEASLGGKWLQLLKEDRRAPAKIFAVPYLVGEGKHHWRDFEAQLLGDGGAAAHLAKVVGIDVGLPELVPVDAMVGAEAGILGHDDRKRQTGGHALKRHRHAHEARSGHPAP